MMLGFFPVKSPFHVRNKDSWQGAKGSSAYVSVLLEKEVDLMSLFWKLALVLAFQLQYFPPGLGDNVSDRLLHC
jgi:hypothetical protein